MKERYKYTTIFLIVDRESVIASMIFVTADKHTPVFRHKLLPRIASRQLPEASRTQALAISKNSHLHKQTFFLLLQNIGKIIPLKTEIKQK
jgi:hypothetical protein